MSGRGSHIGGVAIIAAAVAWAGWSWAAAAPPGAAKAGAAEAAGSSGIRIAQAPVARPRPKPKPKNVIENAGARLTARLAPGMEPLREGLTWEVSATDRAMPPIRSRYGQAAIELEPGAYRVEVAAGTVNAEADFTVAPDETTEVEIVLDAGRLTASVRPGGPTMPFDDVRVAVSDLAAGNQPPVFVGDKGTIDTIVPAGRYRVEARLGLARAETVISVEPGRTADAELVLEVGFVLANAYAAEGTEPLSGATFILGEFGGGAGQAGEIARTSGRHGLFALSPGTYRLAARYGLAGTEQQVRVAANRLSTIDLTLNAARLEVDTIAPAGDPASESPPTIRIFAAGSADNAAEGVFTLLTEVENEKPVLRLPAGKYVVEAEQGGWSDRTALELRPGESRFLRLAVGSGELVVTARTGDGVIDGSPVRLTATPLMPAEERPAPPLDLGHLSDQPLRLPAGRYLLSGVLEPGGAAANTEIEIAAGGQTRVELAFNVGKARLEIVDRKDGAAVTHAHWRLSGNGLRRRTTVIGGAVELQLAPGTYDVTAEAGEIGASGQLTVEAGQLATLKLIAE